MVNCSPRALFNQVIYEIGNVVDIGTKVRVLEVAKDDMDFLN
jgi:hypothetical protein